MEASCHCGSVRFRVAEVPARVTECNCSICSRLGTLWAYYHPSRVTFLSEPGATLEYAWGDRRINFHTCRTCGCTTHWSRISGEDSIKMGINARLLEGLNPEDVAVEHLDFGGEGRFWTRG